MKALVAALLLAASPALAADDAYWSGPWLCGVETGCVLFYADGLLFHNGIAVATIRHGVVRTLEGKFLQSVPPEPKEAPRVAAPAPARPCGRWASEGPFGYLWLPCE